MCYLGGIFKIETLSRGMNALNRVASLHLPHNLNMQSPNQITKALEEHAECTVFLFPWKEGNTASLAIRLLGCWAVVAHAFNPSTWEAEAGRFPSLRPA